MPKSTTPPIAKYWTAPTAENILSHLHSANDMNIHRLLLVFYLLQETEISQPQMVITSKQFPSFQKPFGTDFALLLNATPHFPTLAMATKQQCFVLKRKIYIRIFFSICSDSNRKVLKLSNKYEICFL
jgi:hypothetical protein